MELSVKVTTALLLSMLSLGGVIKGFQVWKEQSTTSMQEHSMLYPQEVQSLHTEIKGKEFPSINAHDIYLRQFSTFQPMEYVSANDPIAGDITPRIEVYGDVDTSMKGEYQIRYVVRNDFGLKTTKYMKVIVD